jgi:TonB family protein
MSSCRVHGVALAFLLAGCAVQVSPPRESAPARAPQARAIERPAPAAAPRARAIERPAPAAAPRARAIERPAPAPVGSELALSPNVLRRRLSTESVNGSLPRGVVQAVIRERNPSISRCYAEGLRRNPGLSGKLSVRFVIARDGSVSEAKLAESSLPDGEVNRCIVAQFSAMRFPQPADGKMTVLYPVQFAPTAAPSAPAPGSRETPRKR